MRTALLPDAHEAPTTYLRLERPRNPVHGLKTYVQQVAKDTGFTMDSDTADAPKLASASNLKATTPPPKAPRRGRWASSLARVMAAQGGA